MHHRIYYPDPLNIGDEISVVGDEFHHAARVVRVRPDEHVELFDGRGRAVEGRVIETTGEALRIAVERVVPSRESKTRIHLAAAIINLDRFELVLQKATELGVASITPVVTDRVDVRPERYKGKSERWEKIVFEAVKQSGRSVIPPLAEPAAFAEAIGGAGTKIFFDADEEPSPPDDSFDEVTLFVGPEGGWSEAEIELARSRRCIFRRLGSRRLRAETAAIVAVAIITARHGDI